MRKRRLFLLLLVCAWTSIGIGQEPERNFREHLAERKAGMLARMRLSESLMTPNQELFDVKYYQLDLNIDPVQEQITGTVDVLAQVIDLSISQMELNFLDNMYVDAVTMSGSPVSYVHNDDLLTVILDRTYVKGELFTLRITYHGKPQQTGFGSFGFDYYYDSPMIWSLSEPFSARNWWPCKDIPSDKADSVDIKITVPADLIVASNGILKDVVDNDSTKTYWWHEGYPITTYLVSVAISRYKTFSDYYKYSPTDSMEVQYFVFPDHYSAVQRNYSKTVGMIEIFSELFGQYPFIKEKYGHAEFLWGGGMEHQTIASLGGWSEALIAHELAHQWWGDMITCRDFHHIWLNEGFATYSESLYWERKLGKQAYFNDVMANQYFDSGTIYVYDLSDVRNIFHYGRSYCKASWVLHMLRHVVGDSTFFKILKSYSSDPRFRYGTATTEDFQEICELISGKNLDTFFHQWIYAEYFPVYLFGWNWVPNGEQYDITLQIDQVQTNTVIFNMPIDVTVTTLAGDTTIVVYDSLQTQTFQFSVNSEPLDLELDKDNWILKRTEKRPAVAGLNQNYPNPFDSETQIHYRLPEATHVEIVVYNSLGQMIAKLLDRYQKAGHYRVYWDGRDSKGRAVSSGIYFYKFQTPEYQKIKKMVLLR